MIVLPSLFVGTVEFAAIVLVIGGVMAATLVAAGVRLRRGLGPPRPGIPRVPGAALSAGELFGWLMMGWGATLAGWSLYNFSTRPKPNELDLIDLVLGLVIAVTLVVVGTRLRHRRRPWMAFLLGFTASVAVFVFALSVALRDFH